MTDHSTEIVQPTSTIGNQSSGVCGVYGISGSGKSSLADTAAEYAYETFNKITLCYAADLGGFGNKRLSLIRAGIMRVYDPRNRVNPFETMELISLGAFPERLVDAERGEAAPDVKLILPRRLIFQVSCPQGHPVTKYDDERVMLASVAACPTCGVMVNAQNSRVEKAIVRHRMFAQVGLRIYDSITALNDWGMADLQAQSARGTLPASTSGGSLLGSADALRSGQFVFGSSSKSQYGFLQNRTYVWLSNIRAIPDQIVPPIATFLTETSKGDDESGGEMLIGPKIAGNARTAALVSWLGNCLHATKEPYDFADVNSPLVHRLWLTNHIDPRVPSRIPYIAKHRGTPLDMPNYLEDKPGAEPWSGCSLGVLFQKLQDQLVKIEIERARKYPNTAGVWTGEEGDADEVVGAANAGAAVGSNGATGASIPVAGPRRGTRRVAGGGAAPIAPPPVAGSTVPVNNDSPAVLSVQAEAAAPPVPSSEIETAGVTGGSTPAQEVPAIAAPAVEASAPPILPSPAPATAPTAPTAAAGRRPIRRIARPPV